MGGALSQELPSLVGQRHQDVHIVNGEEARVAVQHAL